MKKHLALPCLFLVFAGAAHAQSSVTMYGVLSEGLMYTSNAGGNRQWQLASGVQQAPRWGITGKEDLGGGNRAVFTLENGFNLSTGTLGQGARLFGRQAFVGLANDRLGQLTFGRQIDTMAQTLAPYEAAVQFATYGPPIGDSDNIFPTFRVNNTIQYRSPEVAGFRLLSAYALSNLSGGFSVNRDFNAGLSYTNGPLSAGIAYHTVDRPNDAANPSGAVSGDYGFTSPFATSATGAGVDKQQMAGIGAAYAIGTARISLMFTHVSFDYADQSRLSLGNYEATVTDYLSPTVLIGLGYIYTAGRYRPTGNAPKWHQVDAGVDWFLSKRTDLFLVGIFQKAAGDAQFARIYYNSPSTSKQQFSASIGVRHKF
ncbi:porin [Burkholderia semiarida]|uniref:Porin n=1 Tax=Burkholderia semiarida TaxID=2843303 RepID=A0ABW7L8J2_9BURK|nr:MULTISPECIES: porin [Burkholderia]KWH51561.1 porin [Burkholderia anthina]MCA7970220.1 porin [Burkholderia sp. AU39826]